MAHYEKRMGGELVYDGKIIKLNVDDVILEDGNSAKREYVRHPGGASVLAVTKEGILFVEQFRYPYGEVVLELPAGKRDAFEEPIVTARRELEEETGYYAEELVLLSEIYPSPGYTDERLYLYLAEGLTKKTAHVDDDEFLSVKVIPETEVLEMLKRKEIKDAKTVICLLEYFFFHKDKR